MIIRELIYLTLFHCCMDAWIEQGLNKSMKLDFCKSYWPVPRSDCASEIFVMPILQYTVTPFRLTNAPKTDEYCTVRYQKLRGILR